MAVASWKSLSALRTHSRVVLFIEDFALGHDFTQERFTFGETPAQVVWSANDEVQRKGRVTIELDLDRLIQLVSRRHDHQGKITGVGSFFRPEK